MTCTLGIGPEQGRIAHRLECCTRSRLGYYRTKRIKPIILTSNGHAPEWLNRAFIYEIQQCYENIEWPKWHVASANQIHPFD